MYKISWEIPRDTTVEPRFRVISIYEYKKRKFETHDFIVDVFGQDDFQSDSYINNQFRKWKKMKNFKGKINQDYLCGILMYDCC